MQPYGLCPTSRARVVGGERKGRVWIFIRVFTGFLFVDFFHLGVGIDGGEEVVRFLFSPCVGYFECYPL
ncbi:hypothetical protein BU24DRAFT_266699 [Aaosphaeria arxii CBS 175.79]|uniref:Transmembrane protein n=1 Tax=Aaosphaeria arxii CBS 175.79 TaxID=1450172 RepID=A0A6A5XFB3_9PLEO|nr:uncharacterized protein BU24DRAFT_266699 [Aaosphaeria arxii CBS 175.79]KAF2011935.1 hypothetical protein BU24DRAFT_266699 [Aaosphaeria arxii CBS 175.79]